MKEKLIHLIADYLGKEDSEITDDSTFQDLGLDSLDLMDLVMQIEEEFGCKLELTQEMDTVAKLCDYVESIQA